MDEDRLQRIHRILSCFDGLAHGVNPQRENAWQRIDLTMPQLKALIYVSRNEGATSGQIATSLGVGLSTITGIVDRLAEQNMVTRREDPRDRRITRVLATPVGSTLVNELLRYRNEVVTEILSQLDGDQLRTVESAFEYLIAAVEKLNRQTSSQEAVA
jgi:DNA-binding MarR family transcriptional regulator